MKTLLPIILVGMLLSIFMFVCFKHSPTLEIQAHEREIQEWQHTRLSKLMRDDSWLTLAGLYWLKDGLNSVGSDTTSAVVFPAGKTPLHLGTIGMTAGILMFEAMPKVEVLHKGHPITSLVMHTDEEKETTILSYGTVSFYVIKRGNQLGVRVKDTQNRARTNFAGLEYFSIDPRWRFQATFEPYRPPKVLELPSSVGIIQRDSCPGALVFEHDGSTYRIDAVVEKGSEDQLFIIFGDETNGDETYEIGRQLYTSLPDSNRRVTIDFNRAYNWPCVFTEFATCPIPPKQNRLPFRIEAGEKMYKGHD